MKNKDEELTYEELNVFNARQEEYIKELEKHNEELEKQLRALCGTKKLEVAKPDYDKLCRQVQSLSFKIEELKEENNALRYSLTRMYIQLESSQAREEIWEEDYYEEHKRAEKLFDDVNKKQ